MKIYTCVLVFLISGFGGVAAQAQANFQIPNLKQLQAALAQTNSPNRHNGTERSVYNRLLSERWDTFDDTTSQWIFTDSIRYGYNNNGYNDTVVTMGYYYGAWQNLYAVILTINDNNALTEELEVVWDDTTNTWKNYNDIIQTFDANNNLLTSIYRYWSPVLQNWVNFDGTTCTYDANNNRLDSIGTEWDSTTAVWLNQSKSIWTYDNFNHPTSHIQQAWYGSWTNNAKEIDTNNTNGNQLVYIRQKWADTDWVNVQKIVALYDSANYRTQDYVMGWDTAKWMYELKENFTYDSIHNLVMWVDSDTYDSMPANWRTDQRAFYTYVDSNKLFSYISENYDTFDSVWTPVDSQTRAYDNRGNETQFQDIIWDNVTNAWRGNVNDSYTYNADNDKIYELNQGYNALGNNYRNYSQYFYYYGQIDPMAVSEFKNEVPASLYPNPAGNSNVVLSISLPGDAQTRISLYDGCGRLVTTQMKALAAGYQNINLNYNTIATGTYYVQVMEYATGKTSVLTLVRQ